MVRLEMSAIPDTEGQQWAPVSGPGIIMLWRVLLMYPAFCFIGTNHYKVFFGEVKSLKKGKNWGIVDMVGGGIIITAIKRSHLDRANQSVHRVQHLLENCQQELADIQAAAGKPLGVDFTGFETFADYFFDGLIFDWIVQSKINKSYNVAVEMEGRVTSLVARLEERLSRNKKILDSLSLEKKALLEV